MSESNLQTVSHFINGEKVKGGNDKYGYVYSPSIGEKIGKVNFASKKEINQTIELAKNAQKNWETVSIKKRVETLFKFRELLVQNIDELAEIIGKESGKTLSDSKGEIGRGIESVDFAIGAPQLLKGDYSFNVGGDINTFSMKQPLGVVTCVSPFNFPIMVPLAMSVIAVTVGNAVILKPSEKVPFTALRIAELWNEAGLPKGIWNVLNGDKDTVNTLITHDDIQAISFVGSTNVASKIYETGTKHHKRVNAFGGGKNHMIIMPDADLDKAVESFLGSAYGSASQRCMAISVAVPIGEETRKKFTKKLKTAAEKLVPGSYDNENADFGALISANAKEEVLNAINKAEKEGANIIIDGRNPEVENNNGFYLGPTLIDNITSDMDIYKDEVFGPARMIISVQSLEQAIKLINKHKYGNGVTIFTNSGKAAHKFKQDIKVGMVGINVAIPIPVSYYNFGGWKESRYGDGQMFGPDSVRFFTKLKTVSERWLDENNSLNEINFDFPTN